MRALAALTLLMLLIACVPACIPAHAQDGSGQLSGVFVYTGGAAERHALERAVDDVCAAMDPVTCLFGRPILLERNAPADEIELTTTATLVRFRLGGWGPLEVPLDGTTVLARTERDEEVRIAAWPRGDGLVIRRETAQGVRVDSFVRGASADTLRVASSIESARLPRVLRFAFTYHRSR